MDKLAVDGGKKAFPAMRGKKQPKIGVEEFLALAERFGFKAETLTRLRAAVSDDDLEEVPCKLARYYCASPELIRGSKFEALARKTFGVKHALSVSSGTGALHSAFVAAGVGPGTEVIVPAVGFMATSAAVMLAGGVPIFCDVDESLHMDPARIEAAVTPRTVALAPTHHWGGVADMDAIMAVARKHSLKVIEDCAQSPGATYKGRYVGTIGDLGCFSISCYKIIGGGEGGLVLTNDERLYERACQLAECGGLWRKDRFAPPRYEGELFVGTNYRMSELEATVDVVQLGKLNDVVRRYREARNQVVGALKTYREIAPQKVNDAEGQVGYMLRFYPETIALGEKIVAALKAEGVSCAMRGDKAGPDWHQYSDMFPVVLKSPMAAGASPLTDPRYVERGGGVDYRRGDCPVADDLYNRAVMVHLDQWYSAEDCACVAAAMNKVLSAYCTEDPKAAQWR
ncbi:MAG: DegT/DnrJ/EryC1/StrS family aminotransferase [Planctomycetes bacterium]|nr:DegT/DnrJ/EryC1/StrS family aminotransferase [Planctomycetota bacterium]